MVANLTEAFDTRVAIKSYEDPESALPPALPPPFSPLPRRSCLLGGDRIDVRDVSELEHALFVYRHLTAAKPTLVLRLFLQDGSAVKSSRAATGPSTPTSAAAPPSLWSSARSPPASPAPPIRTPPPSPRRNTGPPAPGTATPPIRTPPQSPRAADPRRRSQPPAKKEKEKAEERAAGGESGLVWSRGQLIGTGGFGSVYLGLTESGAFIAVKQMELAPEGASADQAAAVASFEKEVQLMRRFSHPNIVRYIGLQHQGTTISILLEYVPGGSIASLLRRFGAFSERVVVAYTRQVLSGLAYLHDNQVVHRDIKGANILVDTNGVCKLADFGCSKAMQTLNVTRNKSVQGTPYWMAPEVIRQAGHGTPADVWSLACTVIEMGLAKPPWAEFTELTAVMFHIATSASLPAFPPFSPPAHDLLTRCFSRTPADRPTADQLLRHPWLASAPASASSTPAAALVAPSPSASLAPVEEHRTQLQSMAARTRSLMPGCLALLPPALLAHVFLALDSADDALRLARVCKAWRAVLADEELFWRPALARLTGRHVALAAALLGPKPPPAWKGKHTLLARVEGAWRRREFSAATPLRGHSKRPSVVRAGEGLVASAAEDKKVKLWDLARRKKLRSLKGHTAPVTCLALDAAWGKLYSGARDRTVRVWDAAERKCVRTLSGATDDVLCVAPFAPARLAAGSADKQLRVWDVATGQVLVAVVAHTGAVACVAEKESIVVSGSSDRSMKLWDLRTLGADGQTANVAPVLTVAAAHADALTAVLMPHTDASSFAIYSAAADGSVREWDLRYTGPDAPAASLRAHTDAVTDLCLSPDGAALVSASRDRTVRLWSRLRACVTHTLAVGDEVTSVALTPHMRLLCTTAADKHVRVYEASDAPH